MYTPGHAARAFGGLRTPIGAVGHTHIPSLFIFDAGDDGAKRPSIEAIVLPAMAEIALKRGTRVILNPGSVGQPRDRNPDASWGVLDSEKMSFRIRRVEFDMDSVSRKIDAAGLPNPFTERLRVGA